MVSVDEQSTDWESTLNSHGGLSVGSLLFVNLLTYVWNETIKTICKLEITIILSMLAKKE